MMSEIFLWYYVFLQTNSSTRKRSTNTSATIWTSLSPNWLVKSVYRISASVVELFVHQCYDSIAVDSCQSFDAYFCHRIIKINVYYYKYVSRSLYMLIFFIYLRQISVILSVFRERRAVIESWWFIYFETPLICI